MYLQDLGATTSTTGWSLAQYDSAAEAKAEATAGNFLIVTVGFDGAFVRAVAYPTYALAASAWDAAYQPPKNLPADTAYALLYNKTEASGWRGVENNLNTVRTSRRTDWKNQIPWIIGGAAVLAAAVYFTRKRGGAPRARRKPFWRRRVVTTWR